MKTNNLTGVSPTRTAVLVDYNNVCEIISELLGPDHNSDELALRMIDEVRAFAAQSLNMNVVKTLAFDTVSSEEPRPHRAIGAWIANGIEPRLHLIPDGKNEAPLDLSIEATKTVLEDNGIDSVIILTGDHWYVPLVRSIRSSGNSILVASLDTPESPNLVATDLFESYFNARNLFERAGKASTNGTVLPSMKGDYAPTESARNQQPVTIEPVEDPIALQALEITEKFFGQYEEVYLTPLLRRLTELMNTDEEPKTTINYLEDCGAVRLEKRRGFPHNFTVLIVNNEHPDVIEIKKAFTESGDEYFDDYDDDEREDFVQQEQIV